jgi:hypothetical protein
MNPLPTTAEILEALKKQPGIDIRRQAPGTTIIVETDTGLYELRVVNPVEGVVQVSGTDPRLHQPVLGRFLRSVCASDPQAVLDGHIGRTMRMVIAFRNAEFESGIVVSATVRGEGWSYDVF